MPFTKTPMASSEQTQQVNLLYSWDSRDNSTNGYDSLLQNALAEPVGEKAFHMLKRYGLEKLTFPNAPDMLAVLGIYHWNIDNLNNNWLVVVYQGYTNLAIVAACNLETMYVQYSFAGGNCTPATPVYFQEFLYQNGSVDLLINVGQNTYKLQNGPPGLTTIVTNGTGALAYLDGYAIQSNGTAILNSNLNDPTTWSPSNFLSVDSYADKVLRIARVGPYIVAFGSESIQYFYNAANPTGTPFGALTGATQRIGYLGGYANVGDDIYFIGQANQQAPTLYKMSGLRVTPIASMPFSRMWLSQALEAGNPIVAPDGSILSLNGHTCYYVSTQSVEVPTGSPTTLPLKTNTYCFDLDSQMWTKLGFRTDTNLTIKSASTFAPVYGTIPLPANRNTMTYVNLLNSGANLYRFNPLIYQDDGVNFRVQFRTALQDFGSRRTKFGGRLLVTGDQTPSSSSVGISWSDNDYKTTSTPRYVDMQYSYQPLYALGSFRARSFTLTYEDNFPMRWQSLELDYNIGVA